MKKILMVVLLIALFIGLGVKAADLIIDSKHQSYSEKDNKIKFEGDVKVNLEDINVYGEKADVTVGKDNQLDTATFYDKPYAVELKNNKKREVKANILKVSLLNKIIRAEGDAQAVVSDGKKPIVTITANEQEYDTNTNIMKANGCVVIHYKEIETYSDRAVINTDKNGELKKIDLDGNAKVKEKKNNSEADHFCYNVVKEELVATGHVTSNMIMDDNAKLILKSSYQQFDKRSNVFTGSGNVRAWYKDYYAEGPKMSVFPDKKTQKFNEIYFTGRSSITEKEKTVYADKIKMVLNPKNFFADGNARTVIKNVKSMNNDGEL